jgi:translation initiation factor 2 subunit 1
MEEEEPENETYGLDHTPNCDLKCRFYENEYPQENEVVMGRVLRVDQLTGAYVSLMEYNNIEALIMFSEFSRKRVKSVHRLVKVGKKEPLLVTKVDEERGFIDLSRKRVNPEDVKACEERYNKHLKVHNIMKQTAAWLEEDLINLYKRIAWPLDHLFPSSYDAFMISLNEPETVFGKIDIDDKTKELLMDNISKRMKPMSYKVCTSFEISCYTFEGVDAVRRALNAREESKDFDVTVRLISSPLFEISTYTPKIQQGIECLKAQLTQIEESITESKGKFKLKSEPCAIGAKEEEDIENMIRMLNEEQNDETGSQNREENDEEGIEGNIEGLDDYENRSVATTATEEAKDTTSDSDGEGDDQ